MSHNARTVVIARTIAEGKKHIAANQHIPVNALVVVCAAGLQGVRISELHWADGWAARRTPEHRRLIETSAQARLHLAATEHAPAIATGSVIDGLRAFFETPVPA